MAPKPTRKGLDGACTRLHSLLVRARAGGCCEVCGGPANQTHHIVGRNCRRLKYEPRNGLSCCGTCHQWAGTHHGQFDEWMRKNRPEDWEWLKRPENIALTHWKLHDYLEIRDDLREKLKSWEI